MKAINIDRQVVHKYVKRSSRRLLCNLKIKSFKIIIKLTIIEVLIKIHCLHLQKFQRH